MMRFIFLVLLMVSSTALTAQNRVAPKVKKSNKSEAKVLAEKLDNELSFTEKQLLAVEKLNKVFIKRRNKIIGNQKISISSKNELLEAIYVEQGNEMADILTRLQINRYAKVRGELQPLVVIEE